MRNLVKAAIAGRPAREALILITVSLGAAVLFYLPFLLHMPSFTNVPFNGQGMERVYGMWDGPLYVTVAATLWDPDPQNPLYGWWVGEPSNYSERFPLYPLVIRLLSPILGYWAASLIINVAASTAVTVFLYIFLRRFGSEPSAAFWVALVSIFWPPRGLLYRYVAMTEPLFILGFLGSVYFFKAQRYLLSGFLGALAVATRPNGFVIVAGLGILALTRIAATPGPRRVQETARMIGLALMPLTLAAVYLWHQLLFGDWLASIHAEAFVRPKLALYPSLTFFGIGEEGVPYLFFLVLAGILELVRRRHYDLALLSALFYVPSLFNPVDVSRYLLPVFPFAFSLAGDRVLATRPLRIALLLSLPLVYTYAWTTLLHPGYQAPFGPLRALLP